MSQEVLEKTFEVGSPAHLKVSNLRGSVDIAPGEDGVITVKAVQHNSATNGNVEIIIEQDEDGLVRVETKYEKGMGSFFGVFKPPKVEYTIRVPQKTNAKVNCVSSKADITGLTGEFQLEGVSGALQLKDLNGRLNINSVSGKLSADNLSGEMNLNNVSGKAAILNSNLPSISGKTVSGNLTIQTPLTEGPYDFNSVSGHVLLVVPEDTACTIVKNSISGRTKVSLPNQQVSGHKHKNLGKGVIEVQEGGVRVSMNSVSGVINMQTELEAPPPAPKAVVVKDSDSPEAAPAAPVDEGPATMDILRQIEDGKISVDEALDKMAS
jgi:hypothetical protein